MRSSASRVSALIDTDPFLWWLGAFNFQAPSGPSLSSEKPRDCPVGYMPLPTPCYKSLSVLRSESLYLSPLQITLHHV